ncbi:MAG: hypothetical protein R3B91_15790 [Planctomycetaceae bacterium]
MSPPRTTGAYPTIIEHLRPLKSFDPHVFSWEYDRKALQTEFDRIQAAATIDDNPMNDDTRSTTYAWAFATLNALNMSEQALQSLMRHASPLTTKRYVNVAQQLNPAVAKLCVPDVG